VYRSTTILLKSLAGYNDLKAYIEEHKEIFIETSLAEHLCRLLEEKQLAKMDVVRQSELSKDYALQLFSGLRKTPSRNKLICLCVAMGLSFEESDGLLKLAGLAPLYAKNKRDSIILYGIEHKQSVIKINQSLHEHGEQTIG